MALSGSFTGTTANSLIVPTITWSATQSVTGNYSDVTATLTYSRTNTGYTTDGKWNGTLDIGGTTLTVTDRYLSITYQSNTVAITHTARVYHGADGTGSVTIRATGYQPSTSLEWTDISATVPLDTIPRASTLTVPALTLGQQGTVTVHRASAAFTHTVTWQLGAERGTLCTRSAATALRWTPPLELARQLPDDTGGQGTLTVTTYQGSGQVGQSQSCPFSVSVPASVVPTVRLSVTVLPGEGVPADWGETAVQGFSRLQYTVTDAGAYGSTIQKRVFTFGTQTGSAASGTTGKLTAAGEFVPTVTVTDSRGRTATAALDPIPVHPCGLPTLNGVSALRCDAGGAADSGGSCLTVSGVGGCAPVGGRNAVTTTVRTRQTGEEWSGAQTFSGSILLQGFDPHRSCEAEVTATDLLGQTRSVTVPIPTDAVTFHLRPGGTGAAFGKYAEEEKLACAWPAAFDGEVSVGGPLRLGAINAAETADLSFDRPADAAYSAHMDVLQNDLRVYTRDEEGVYGQPLTLSLADGALATGPLRPSTPVEIAHGGTGAGSVAAAIKNFCNGKANTAPTYVLGFNSGYAGSGYTTMANLRKALGITDFVVEQGTSGIWTWQKWNSGMAQCWGNYVLGTVAMTKAWGSLYESTTAYQATFPSGLFTAAPTYLDIQTGYGGGTAAFVERGNTAPTAAATDKFFLVRPTSATGQSMNVYIHAIGKWK